MQSSPLRSTPPPTMSRHRHAYDRAPEPIDLHFSQIMLALELIRNKWTIPVLAALDHAPAELRYTEILRTLGISGKMLSATLRDLVRNGLITRRVEHSSPQSVYYGISDLGVSLAALLSGVRQWGQANMTAVDHARHHFDTMDSHHPTARTPTVFRTDWL